VYCPDAKGARAGSSSCGSSPGAITRAALGKRRFFLFSFFLPPLFPDTPGVSLTHWLELTGMLACAGASLSVQFSGKGLRVFANGRQISVADQLADVRASLLLAAKR